MMKLVSFLLLSCVTFFAVEGRQACDFNAQTIQQAVMTCMEHSPRLALQIALHMNNPGSLESSEFICKYKSEVADLIVCMENKLATCMPGQSRLLMEVLPKKEALEKGFDFMCKHKDVMNSKCFESQMAPFMQCYMGNLKQLSTATLATSQDPLQTVCTVIRAEEKCFMQNRGTCSDDFISMIVQLLETVFSMDKCPKQPNIQTVMDSILVHGQPLKFQPMKGSGYIIKN